jgi:toxin-antitoxin system PIN domain toxin
MTALLDVNTLVAVALPEHTFHRQATEWFDTHCDSGWATCSITESGFVRVASNPAISDGAIRPRDAIDLLAELTGVGAHAFWIDDVQPTTSDWFPASRLVGYRQTTDAQLLALSRRHGGSLATFDKGLVVLAKGLSQARVELVTENVSG